MASGWEELDGFDFTLACIALLPCLILASMVERGNELLNEISRRADQRAKLRVERSKP